MPTAGDDRIDLQSAADQLGVHYQTAYRWVRSGKLRADLIGGRYLVTREELDAVEVERRTPSAPPPPGPKRITTSASRMHDALVSGDERSARTVVRALLSQGTPLIAMVQQVIVPPLVRIGQAWSDGNLTILVEHRASAIVERIIGEIAPNPRGRRRGTGCVAEGGCFSGAGRGAAERRRADQG